MKLLSSRRVSCREYRGRIPFDFTVIDGLFLPEGCETPYLVFSDDGFLDVLEQITGLEGIAQVDASPCAGLAVHVDAGLPGVNALLFPKDSVDGLQLWSQRDTEPFKLAESIEAKAGRLVLFDPHGFHLCPAGTVQAFYTSHGSG